MTRKAIGGGVYVDPAGGFWARPWINRRRTWRKLKAVKERTAIAEANTVNFQNASATFAAMADLYLEAQAPNRRLEPRQTFVPPERRRLQDLNKFFGPMPCAEIRLHILPKYRAWRIKTVRHGTGDRTVDKDFCTLSNVLNYAVATGQLEFNFIRAGRPRYRKHADVRHCREVAPHDADTIHRLADHQFCQMRGDVLGWQLLFAALTGCRTSELLRLRLDAKNQDQPGFIQSGTDGKEYLFLGRRSKGGVNPWVQLGPELRELLECFRYWHRLRETKSTWYFPSPTTRGPVNYGALGHALTRLCADLKLHHITPHGLRSFYVTKRRSDGASDTIIAGEIGDQTVTLMQTTYGSRPPNWSGGKALSWLPKEGLPAWKRWQPAGSKLAKISKNRAQVD